MAEATTDGELVLHVAAGGDAAKGAEATLCERFAPRILAYGLRHLRDADRARDLVQAVLLGLLEAARAGRIAEVDKVDRYVLGTCRNTTARMRATAARAEPTADHVLAAIPAEPVEVLDTPALVRCLEKLEPRASQVVLLAFNEERSAAEIATALDLTAGNVRVVRHRALHALRRCLDGKEDGREARP